MSKCIFSVKKKLTLNITCGKLLTAKAGAQMLVIARLEIFYAVLSEFSSKYLDAS